MRTLLLDQGAQGSAVGHVDHMRPVCDLVAGCIGITVHSDGFHAEALQGDDDFLAEFAAAEEHDAGGGRGERGAEFHGEGFQKKLFATELTECTEENQGINLTEQDCMV